MARTRTTWPIGEKPPVLKPKGNKHKKTIIKEMFGAKSWADLSDFIDKQGFEHCIRELSKLEGKDYISCYISLLEFVKPKLARTENIIEDNRDLDISKLSTEELNQLVNMKRKLENNRIPSP